MAATLHEAAGGDDGVLRLAVAWHARVLADDVVGHAVAHGDRPDHVERLAAHGSQVPGGPTRYGDELGDETTVLRIRSGTGPHEDMDDRAIECFAGALDDVALVGPVHDELLEWFSSATRGRLARYHDSADDVPDDLEIPRWAAGAP